MHINVSRVFISFALEQITTQRRSITQPPEQTAETARRRQIINTQGGVVRFRLCSALWSEGGPGWWGGALSDRDG